MRRLAKGEDARTNMLRRTREGQNVPACQIILQAQMFPTCTTSGRPYLACKRRAVKKKNGASFRLRFSPLALGQNRYGSLIASVISFKWTLPDHVIQKQHAEQRWGDKATCVMVQREQTAAQIHYWHQSEQDSASAFPLLPYEPRTVI